MVVLNPIKRVYVIIIGEIMKTKKAKMIRRMVKKDLLALLKQVSPRYREELDGKIREMTKLPKTKDSWRDLINLIEYYIAKDYILDKETKPIILNARGRADL
jgi:hypothetical protein